MKKKEKFIQEEEQLRKDILSEYLAAEIALYYKYYKNKGFETFSQYCNSYNSIIILTENETKELYHKVDSIMEEKYNLFFAHYELEDPIYLVDVSGKDESE